MESIGREILLGLLLVEFDSEKVQPHFGQATGKFQGDKSVAAFTPSKMKTQY